MLKKIIFSLGLLLTCPVFAEEVVIVDKADNGFMMICTALVLFMSVPGIAFFYGGLLRSKNVLSMLSQVLVTFSLIAVLWIVYGYSLAFGEGNWFFGNFEQFLLVNVGITDISGSIYEMIWIAFQGSFACITCLKNTEHQLLDQGYNQIYKQFLQLRRARQNCTRLKKLINHRKIFLSYLKSHYV